MDTQNTIRRKPVAKSTVIGYEAVETNKPEDVGSSSEQPAVQPVPELSKTSIFTLIAVVVGCTLVILAAVVYLTFLWFGDHNKASWKRIVFSNWTTTSVAVCALAIRWTSSFQTILCTSLLALRFLRKGVPVSKIPRISTIRYSNSGPLDIMWLAAPALWRNSLHLSMICLLTLGVSLLLQFSSTLLLSDLAISSVEAFAQETRGKGLRQFEGSNSEDPYSLGRVIYSDPLLSTTPSYPVFAEYNYPDENKPYSEYGDPELASYLSPWANLIDDTEPTIRVLLPLNTQQNRSELLSYDGNATLYDARWMCVPPKLENLSMIGTFPGRGVLSGTSTFPVWLPEFYQAGSSDFACQIGYTSVSSVWSIFTCCLTGDVYSGDQFGIGGMISTLDYMANKSNYYYYDELNKRREPQGIGHTWLVINVTNFTSYPGMGEAPNNYKFNNSSAWNVTMPKSGPWVHLTSSKKHDGTDTITSAQPWSFGLDVTLCSNALSLSKNMHIYARRGQVSAEPSMTDDGLKQLGATRKQYTIEERGLFRLNETELWYQLNLERKGPYKFWPGSTKSSWLSNLLTHSIFTPWGNLGYRSILMQNTSFFWGREIYGNQSNEDLALVLQRVIQTTESPARAMQVVQHVIFSNRYYRYLPFFNVSLPQSITYGIEAIQPVRIRGFVIVATAIGAHIAVTLYVVVAFGVWQGSKRTLSSINQAWQVFAQVSDLQKEVALEDTNSQISSTSATDHTVNAALKHRGLKDKIFVLDDPDEAGVARFRPKDDEKNLGDGRDQ